MKTKVPIIVNVYDTNLLIIIPIKEGAIYLANVSNFFFLFSLLDLDHLSN